MGLARAVYSKAEIIVDSAVAKHIFDNVLDCTNGILKDSIRVLVTHQTQFLHRMDKVMIMENGLITHFDSLTNLNQRVRGIDITSLIDENKRIDNIDQSIVNNAVSNINNNNNEDKVSNLRFSGVCKLRRNSKLDSSIRNLQNLARTNSIIKKESIEKGKISFLTYSSLCYASETMWGQKRSSLYSMCKIVGINANYVCFAALSNIV